MTDLPPQLPPLSERERDLLARARRITVPSDAERGAGWRRLAQATDVPRARFRWWVPATAAVAAVAVVAVARFAFPPAPTAVPHTVAVAPRAAPELAAAPSAKAPVEPTVASPAAWSVHTLGDGPSPIATVSVQAGATVRLPADARTEPRIALDEGLLCAEVAHRDVPRQGPLIVATPQVEVVVIGTRFCVEVERNQSTVSVQEGRVRVENAAGGRAFVGAGESLRSNELPATGSSAKLAPSPTLKPPSATCPVGGPLQPREDCLAHLSEGQGLAAQNALFALALLARDEGRDGRAAISFFHSYLGRFPNSPLAPEASLASVAELRAEKRDGEALTEADRYLSHYAQAGRADEVELLRANLLRERLSRPQDAVAAYDHVAVTSERPALRDEASFGKALAVLALGQVEPANRALEAYLETFPNGAHAAEAARLRHR